MRSRSEVWKSFDRLSLYFPESGVQPTALVFVAVNLLKPLSVPPDRPNDPPNSDPQDRNGFAENLETCLRHVTLASRVDEQFLWRCGSDFMQHGIQHTQFRNLGNLQAAGKQSRPAYESTRRGLDSHTNSGQSSQLIKFIQASPSDIPATSFRNKLWRSVDLGTGVKLDERSWYGLHFVASW